VATHRTRLADILEKAASLKPLTREEIGALCRLEAPDQCADLWRTARQLRRRFFGEEIFLYGFLYISTFCRNDCRFCYYRKSNPLPRRYRKTTAQIVNAALRLADAGVHLIDLTMGEDPSFGNRGEGYQGLIEAVESVRRATATPIMVSPGLVPQSLLHRLAAAGATWYACYQETHRRAFFHRLRSGQDYERRLAIKRRAHASGLLIEEGVLCGVGESGDDLLASMTAMADLDADQMRAMTFVPQPGTPMAARIAAAPWREILTIAIMRLLFPDRLIPASLDVDGLAGLRRRLDAGANVVTSLVPPGEGLAGVAQHALDIEEGHRTPASVRPVIEAMGLRIANGAAYRAWITRRLNAHARRAGKWKC
jgi:methylornithine synthase